MSCPTAALGGGSEPAGSIVLIGGTSDIGLAVVAGLLARRPAPVVLLVRPSAGRLPAARRRMAAAGATRVRVVAMDAADTRGHTRAVRAAFDQPVDVVVVALGILGDPEQAWTDQPTAVQLFSVNTTATVSFGVLVAALLRGQAARTGRRGRIIALSSVAAERVRRANFAYGASKAGMDGFYRGLGDALRPEGIRVLVVRPGFVRTRMTRGRRAALAVDPGQVARRVLEADAAGRSVVRVPAVFGPIMAVYRLLPDALARRLPW